MSGALPTFVIIGAQKCGTTALHSYLSRHPEISMSKPKELDFFAKEHNWDRGLDWYRERFDPTAAIRGESSPNYTAWPKLDGVPERMASVLPDARLIFMVRDPIDRIRANWIHAYSNRAEHRPMVEAVLDPESSYVLRSRYHQQLTRFLEHYPSERILLLEQDELLTDRRETMRRVFEFVGVRDPDYWRKKFNEPRLETAARRRRTWLGAVAAERLEVRHYRKIRNRWPFSRPFEHTEMDDGLRARLVDLLADDTERFRELTGRRFESWSL